MPRLSADERREQLAEAAIRVMIRDGVARTTTRAVVTEAGVPLGAFHYCFRSKEELFQTVIERIMERNLPPGDLAPPEGATPFEAVRAILRAYWEQVRARPAEHLVTYEVTQYALRSPGLADLARRQYRHYLDVNAAHLEAMGRAAGLAWTVELPVLARHGLGVLDGLTLTWLIDRDDAQALAALDEYARYLASVAVPLPAAGRPGGAGVSGPRRGSASP
ncbi:TetR/AcrR family transcriptional regulator [Streptomyces termitum]|uniref:Transcriptional regulator, TetR family protein n=1 Tax=Streptomyces termitum TaxID=67368 RepID=A0A918TD42_9ACTN|nr:TetR/AcrR family transcriptional regulator [Streptomyces termitum]GHB10249.1 putative transcriptional regulator, TetR family protein [Streptomyces termitum]